MENKTILNAIEVLDNAKITSKPTKTLAAFCLRIYNNSNHQIARALDVDPETVRTWILKLYELDIEKQRIILHGAIDYALEDVKVGKRNSNNSKCKKCGSYLANTGSVGLRYCAKCDIVYKEEEL